MVQLVIGDIYSATRNFGEYLDSEIKHFKTGMVDYWNKKGSLHGFLELCITENDELSLSLPKFKFSCLTKERFVFSDKDLIAEVEFFLRKKDEEITILRCFLSPHGTLSFDKPKSDQIIDLSYDHTLEQQVVNKLVSSASSMGLISINQ